ncbi:hypothetical protein E1B28_001293 [Marasmius oreades]|uniref:Uncharacterized protein n=1 Tax=Marasmius oreades TaxID=181124 RepID=A0A9P7V3F7_9AGAR|nr:uncharacterized protein E1B28_001293 [Marasmius oreades]KAG7099442.1 hypothetical protein E1B28_001293 [Marasmius oreades]
MNSDDYFHDIDLDEAALLELDAIEAADTQPASAPPNIKPTTDEDSFFDESFNFDDNDLAILDKELAELEASTQVFRIPSYPRTSSKNMLQTTLLGEVLPAEAPSSSYSATSNSSRIRQKSATKRKKWDHTEFAKSGWKSSKNKGKGKGKATESVEEDAVEFEQFPAPFVSGEP